MAIVILVMVGSGLEGISFSLLVPLTQTFTSNGAAGASSEGGIFGLYQSWLASYSMSERLAILGMALMALFALKNGVQYLRELLSTSLWISISGEIRMNVLASVLHHPYRYFLDNKQGNLVQRLYNEPHHVAIMLRSGIDQAAQIMSVLALFALLVIVSWQVTAAVVLMGVLFGLLTWKLSRRADADGEARKTFEADAMALLAEVTSGIRQIKIFSAEDRIRQLYDRMVRRFQDVNARHWSGMLLPARVSELFWIGVVALLLCLPALGLVKDTTAVLSVVTVFAAVAFRTGPYLSRISQGWLTIKFYAPALRVVGEMLQQPAIEVAHRRTPHSFKGLSDCIRFETVSFFYGSSRPALCDISIDIKRGETTAIVGPSGAGKSTLVDLLVRLYDPSSGVITVDGVDLQDYDPSSWLAKIGFVSQDTFIFHGSIRENIAFSSPGASLKAVENAARQANAHDFIERSPQGYETIVGDRGLKLSGGERQRIAIARALLRDPEILIFDEATSALDNQSEALVRDAIAGIAHDRTVILIAHRLSTIVRADRIIVLDKGKVVEEGTHASLLEEGGVYSSLYRKELA